MYLDATHGDFSFWILRSTQMVIAFLDIFDQSAHAAQPCLVGIAADIDRLDVEGLARRHAAHFDVDVQDQVAHLLHPAQRDALGAERFADIDLAAVASVQLVRRDRKSTRLNSSHSQISYAVFCLKKKKAQP